MACAKAPPQLRGSFCYCYCSHGTPLMLQTMHRDVDPIVVQRFPLLLCYYFCPCVYFKDAYSLDTIASNASRFHYVPALLAALSQIITAAHQGRTFHCSKCTHSKDWKCRASNIFPFTSGTLKMPECSTEGLLDINITSGFISS
jgi:hypothetical protein